MARPTSVTVIAWVYIIFGALMTLSGVFNLLMSFVMPIPPPTAAQVSQMPPPFALMTRLFDFFPLIAALQVVVGTVMIAAGAAFLRLRSWARAVIEVIAWLGLAYTVTFGVFWIWSLSSMMADVPMVAFGTVMIIAFSIPGIVIIRVARGPVVRQAIAAAAA